MYEVTSYIIVSLDILLFRVLSPYMSVSNYELIDRASIHISMDCRCYEWMRNFMCELVSCFRII